MDNPWIEHARWKPTCEFVLVNQGQDFAQAARELTSNNRHVSVYAYFFFPHLSPSP